MPKKRNLARWYTKKLDIAFSTLVRNKGRCERCGRTENLQLAHIIPRTNKTLRWDIFNAVCLCVRCHIWWAHKDPLAFTDWFVANYPQRAVYLEENRNKLVNRSVDDYQVLLDAINNKDLKALITFYPVDK